MQGNFDQSIFGELVQPKRVMNQPKQEEIFKETLSPQIPNNGQFNQQPPSAFEHQNSQPKYTVARSAAFQKPAIKLNQQYSFAKELSTKSTQIGENMRETGKKQTTIRKINSSDLFPCFNCKDSNETNKCQICEGAGYIKGTNNLAKFIEYIMQFKLGLQPSYQQIKQKNKQKQSQKKVGQSCCQAPRIVCRSSQPNQRFSNFQQFQSRKSIGRNQHIGYGCNGCTMYPIVGPRFHCSEPSCKDDYDLCQNCYLRLDHQHFMEEITESQAQQNLQIFSSLLVKPKQKQPVKVFSSSIY